MAAERHLTVGEASRVLGMSRTTLLAAEDAGLLTPLRTPGGHRRYDPAELRRYLRGSGGAPADRPEPGRGETAAPGDPEPAGLAAAVRVALRALVRALDADTAGLYLLHEGELRFATGFAVPRWLAERLAAGPPPPPVGRALAASRPCLFDPAEAAFPEPRATGHGFTTALRQDGRVLGVLFVVAGHELLPGELRFVDALRDLVGMLVEDQRRIAALEQRLARIAALSAP